MTNDEWIEKLKNTKSVSDRVKLVSQHDCPEFIIKIMVGQDTEKDVVSAGVSNPSCSDKIKALGDERLLAFKEAEKVHETLCPIMWNHLAIQQNGDLRQCCQMIYSPFGRLMSDDKSMKISDQNVELARNHPSSKQIRKDMMNGKKPDVCRLCWQEEDVGIHSKRMCMLKKYDMKPLLEHTKEDGEIDTNKIPLTYLDLRLGNLCNLKCRICGPGDSSLWVEDYAKLHQKNNKASMPYFNNQTYDIIKTDNGWKIDSDDFSWHNNPDFYIWLETKINNGLDRLYFTGGEPTVNKNHMKILEKIIESDKADEFTLEYNTNMVAIPPKLINYWRKFKKVEVGASIDAIGPLAKYVRYPSNWNVIEKNCDKLDDANLSQLSVGITTTISVLNIRHLPDISKWLIDKNYTSFIKLPTWHLLHVPTFLNIQMLPDDMKNTIEKEFIEFFKWADNKLDPHDNLVLQAEYSKIIKFMKQDSKISELPNFKKFTYELDEIRGESLANSIPWLYEIVK